MSTSVSTDKIILGALVNWKVTCVSVSVSLHHITVCNARIDSCYIQTAMYSWLGTLRHCGYHF
jgi:hypothetical protein